MKNVIIVIVLLALGALGLYYYQTRVSNGGGSVIENGNGGESTTTPSTYKDLVRLETPRPNDRIASPLLIKGEARGNWYFEASFPVELLDAGGNRLAIAPAQAKGEWMTTEYVPFEVELQFTTATTTTGTLILHKDNPSGLPEHDDSFRIPVRFR